VNPISPPIVLPKTAPQWEKPTKSQKKTETHEGFFIAGSNGNKGFIGE
jgi:hypothetical protein